MNCLVFIVLAVLKPESIAINFYIYVITIIGQLITRHQSSLHWQTIVYYGHLLGSVLDLPITNLLPFFYLATCKEIRSDVLLSIFLMRTLPISSYLHPPFFFIYIAVISFILHTVKNIPFGTTCLLNKVHIDKVCVWLDIESKVPFHFVSIQIDSDET